MKEYILAKKENELIAVYYVNCDLYYNRSTQNNTLNAISDAIKSITNVALEPSVIKEIVRDSKALSLHYDIAKTEYSVFVRYDANNIIFHIAKSPNELEWQEINK
jgi:hypothetical protein